MEPPGGWRPIGHCCSLCRLRGRTSRNFDLEWGVNRQRTFFARRAFASASDAVWRQGFRAEAGIST
eukprot:6693355-Pyramimonas_sp.AAC.1